MMILYNGGLSMSNQEFMWVDITKVLPNDKNPRVDPSVNVVQLKNTLKRRGFEEAIVVYKNERGPFYTIISGHRRWFAARELGLKEVPVRIRPRPETEDREIERLGAIQGGQVDWDDFEYAKYAHNLYTMQKTTIEEVARKMGATKALTSARINIFEFYEPQEIAEKLANKTYSMKMLNYIRIFAERLKRFQPQLVHDLSEEKVRRWLLRKYENRYINSSIVNDESMPKATYDQAFEFLTNPTMTISDLRRLVEESTEHNLVKNYMQNRKSVRSVSKELDILMKPRNKKQAEILLQSLSVLQNRIEKKKQYLKDLI